jgi:hypothetical protein
MLLLLLLLLHRVEHAKCLRKTGSFEGQNMFIVPMLFKNSFSYQ